MDQDKLIDAVTKTIMERLAGASPSAPVGSAGQPKIVVFGNVPGSIFAPGLATHPGVTPADVEGNQVIVLSLDAFRAIHGGGVSLGASARPVAGCQQCAEVDLSGKRLISETELKAACPTGGCSVRVSERAVLTALARDYATANKINIVKG